MLPNMSGMVGALPRAGQLARILSAGHCVAYAWHSGVSSACAPALYLMSKRVEIERASRLLGRLSTDFLHAKDGRTPLHD